MGEIKGIVEYDEFWSVWADGFDRQSCAVCPRAFVKEADHGAVDEKRYATLKDGVAYLGGVTVVTSNWLSPGFVGWLRRNLGMVLCQVKPIGHNVISADFVHEWISGHGWDWKDI